MSWTPEELPSALVEAKLSLLWVPLCTESEDVVAVVVVGVELRSGVVCGVACLAFTLLFHPESDVLTLSAITVLLNLVPICHNTLMHSLRACLLVRNDCFELCYYFGTLITF